MTAGTGTLLLMLALAGSLFPQDGHSGGLAAATLTYPCPSHPGPPPSPLTMPALSEQFVMYITANVVQKQATSEAVQAYDYPNNRAAMSITSNNQTVTSIFNYGTGERFDLMPDGSCQTLSLNQSAFDVFGFTELRRDGQAVLMKPADVFRFGDGYDRTFVGEERVGGVDTYHWQSCQTWQAGGVTRAAYVIDYYFSKPGYSTATSESLIPVLALINGTAINVDSNGKPIGGTHNFSHVYNFAFFRPGPVEDEPIFEIPRGTVCRRLNNKKMPQLPDQFSLSMEVYVSGSQRPPISESMLFDHQFGLIQTDRYAPRGMGPRFGLTKLTIVEDYNNGVQYVIDAFDGNCSVTAMPEGLGTSGGPGGQGEGTKGDITMRHGQQLLRHGSQDFQYQGQRWLRDMKVDVWAYADGKGMVQEVYFLAGWPSERIRNKISMINLNVDLSRMSIMVGTYLLNTTAVDNNLGPFFQLFGDRALKQWGDRWTQKGAGAGGPGGPGGPGGSPRAKAWGGSWRPGDLLRQRMPRRRFGWDVSRMRFAYASEKLINIFNYVPLHMDMTAFDVSSCPSSKDDETFVYFAMEGGQASVVNGQRYLFMTAAKTAIGKAAGISPLRVAKINVWQDLVTARLNIFFSMLAAPSVQGAPKQPSCQDAYSSLKAAVSEGMVITITHPLRQTRLTVVADSLKTWDSLDELWGKMAPQGGPGAKPYGAGSLVGGPGGEGVATGGDSGYSDAQFGGMAFGMLLLGMVVGVGALYVALRRLRPDIHLVPYQQSK